MNVKTKQQIMKNRELLKGYNDSDIGAEKTDQQQKLPGSVPVKALSCRRNTNKSSG